MVIHQFRMPIMFPLGERGSEADRKDLEQRAEVKMMTQIFDQRYRPLVETFTVKWSSGRALGEATMMGEKEGDE
jgi:hypothetical protein